MLGEKLRRWPAQRWLWLVVSVATLPWKVHEIAYQVLVRRIEELPEKPAVLLDRRSVVVLAAAEGIPLAEIDAPRLRARPLLQGSADLLWARRRTHCGSLTYFAA